MFAFMIQNLYGLSDVHSKFTLVSNQVFFESLNSDRNKISFKNCLKDLINLKPDANICLGKLTTKIVLLDHWNRFYCDKFKAFLMHIVHEY
ncbi:hypothetical protein BpHYR1_054392 [Brachionus plicatilis]|uniref:Uncharacterized protein n=1 Tax=Brachionus plicatilis TaxID=10195 RepID=A0A3M7QIY6_BRAPC|nr:hypothetical protein BpHYR1_054392 [Brachionus plicatilis]